MILTRVRSFFTKLIVAERCSKKLALSFCMGIYVAFSPFIGLHTAMTFFFGWLFALNTAIILAVSLLINNPWTMVPVYGIDHFFGLWFFNLFNIDSMAWNPSWLVLCNGYLQQYIGISGISLSAFMFGGNVLGIIISVSLYPFIKHIFNVYLSKRGSRCCCSVEGSQKLK